MSLKTLAHRATTKVSGKVGKQMLTVQKNSPTLLFGLGTAGLIATVVLACNATLKLSDTLAEGEEHLKKVEVTVKEGDETKTKKSMNIRLQTAIKVAKLYAPAVIAGTATIMAFTGSHIILKKRNAGLAAAFTIAAQDFKQYRQRVVEDQGTEKDLEYRFGVAEREIVEEGPTGPEVRVIRGLDQKQIEEEIEAGRTYARLFTPKNSNWQDIPNQNQHFIQMVLMHARDLLEIKGVVFLSDVYDMLGFERTQASQQVGWISTPKYNEHGVQTNDTFVDFGLWSEGIHKGKQWVNGNPEAFLLDFNVDGAVLDYLEKM